MITDQPYFFDRKTEDIKNILKKQGNKTCKKALQEKALLAAVKKFDFGYAILKNKAAAGNKVNNINDKYLLAAYILFRIDYFNNEPCIYVELICSHKNYKGENYGKMLLDLCIEYGKNNEIFYVQLHSLNEIKLLEWYMANEFSIVAPIKVKDEIKVYLMERYIK